MQHHFPDRNLKQKGHVFFRHAMEYARRWGNLTYFYEHGIEHLHAVYNRQARNYKMGEIERQHRLLKWNYLQCLLEARRSPPADAQEYLFAADEEDPTFYYEEEDDDDH
ncbi:hypothetical protein DdX_00843 [Ditylenchus destructor]|uniref:Uncharacterized protein n=1 Tax=Ditylenchus destructor TaxID=166010 RepID=A0AAD4RDI2_9BILA|nr:hypothetical protein DdX_00843 [Ditylenchus destructor]